MKRKLTALLLALALIISVFPLQVLAGDENEEIIEGYSKETVSESASYESRTIIGSGVCGENLIWEFGEGLLVISGTGEMFNYDSTNNRAPWMQYTNYYLKEVVIEDGVTSIGSYAFYGITSANVFTKLTVGKDVSYIGELALYGCRNLSEVVFKGDRPEFYVRRDDNGTIVEGAQVFSGTYPKISYFCEFQSWENNRNEIDAQYREWIEIHNIEYLTNTVPATCVETGAAIYQCACGEETRSDTIPAHGHYMENCVCIYCGLEARDEYGTCGQNARWTLSREGDLIISGSGEIDSYFYEAAPWHEFCGQIKTITVNSGITRVNDFAFDGCYAVKSVTLATSVRSLARAAFNGNRELTEISLPDGIIKIEDGAFMNCTSLKTIFVPYGAGSIGSQVFLGCSDNLVVCCEYKSHNSGWDGGWLNNGNIILEHYYGWSRAKYQLYIDKSINASSLKGFDCLTDTMYWTYSADDVLSIFGEGEMPNFESSVDVPWATFIQDIKEVNIAQGVTSISNYAFRGNKLESIAIPNSVTTIGNYAFEESATLKDISLPDSLSMIGVRAFNNCVTLESIAFPVSLSEIKYGAFRNCSNLQRVTFEGDAVDFGYTTYGNGVVCLPDCAFYGTSPTVLYPCNNRTWDELPEYFGGNPAWTPNHAYTATQTEPTCTESGGLVYTCGTCGDRYIENEVLPLGHAYIATVVNPTCTEGGYTAHVCSRCTDEYRDEATEAHGHMYHGHVTEPTCAAVGYTTYICERCEDTYQASQVPALGHEYVSVVTVPTCTETGYTTHTCTRCNSSYTDATTEKLNHEYVISVTDATCTEAGYSTYTCRRCHDSYKADEIAVLGHNYIVSVTAPTCTETGYTTYTCHCGASYTADEVEPLGHDYDHGICTRCKEIWFHVAVFGETELLSGKTVTLTAELQPYNKTNATLVWSVVEGEDFASVSNAGKLTTRKVTEEQAVTVRVETADNSADFCDYKLKLLPSATSVRILNGEETVTGGIMLWNLRDSNVREMTFTAECIPVSASQNAKWTCSDSKGVYLCFTDNNDGTVTISPSGTGKTGTVTLTATAQDGSKKKATVKIKLARLVMDGELVVTDAPETLLGGTTVTLKTNIATMTDLTDKGLTWNLSSESKAYAAISAAGKLTTKTVGEETTITVIAATKANPDVFAEIQIILMPKPEDTAEYQPTSEIRIFRNSEVVTNDTVILDTGVSTILNLTAKPYPIGRTSTEEVSWKSSNPKIATVDANGVVTGIKAGTVTLTATAKDGSGVKATVKVTVQVNVHAIHIANETPYVVGGKKLSLKASFEPEMPSNNKVTWSLRPQDAPYATISSKGVITAKKVTGLNYVFATVRSVSNPDAYDTVRVAIYPMATAVNVYLDGNKLGKSIAWNLNNGDSAQLVAKTTPYYALNEFTFKSSNNKLATVDEQGLITFTGNTGTVKITVKASDGSGKSTTISITITK